MRKKIVYFVLLVGLIIGLLYLFMPIEEDINLVMEGVEYNESISDKAIKNVKIEIKGIYTKKVIGENIFEGDIWIDDIKIIIDASNRKARIQFFNDNNRWNVFAGNGYNWGHLSGTSYNWETKEFFKIDHMFIDDDFEKIVFC